MRDNRTVVLLAVSQQRGVSRERDGALLFLNNSRMTIRAARTSHPVRHGPRGVAYHSLDNHMPLALSVKIVLSTRVGGETEVSPV